MRLLSRYTLKQIGIPAFLALAVILFLGVAADLRERVQELDITQLTLDDIARLIMFLIPGAFSIVIPYTFMVGILMAFSRMAQNSELIAMKASGIPLRRIVAPVLVGGVALSGLSFEVQDRVQPWAVEQSFRFINSELPLRVALESLPEGRMYYIGDTGIYFARKDPASKSLFGLVVKTKDTDGQQKVYFADEASAHYEEDVIRLEMRNGRIIQASEGKYSMRPPQFDSAQVEIEKAKPEPGRIVRGALTLRELLQYEGQLSERYEMTRHPADQIELRKTRRDVAARFSVPLMCLALAMIAAPLGARSPTSGRSYTFAIGFLAAALYWILRLNIEPGSLKSLATFVGRAQIPNAIFILTGIWFTWRVDRV